MRALIIDDAAKARVKQVLDYAEAHLYYMPAGGQIPGDNPNFVANLHDGFRCVFTYTRTRGETWRHLSISVAGEKYPNPFAAFTIAELFGFTGWDGKTISPGAEWSVGVNQSEHCVVIAQFRDRAQLRKP